MNNFEKFLLQLKTHEIKNFVEKFSTDPDFIKMNFQILVEDTDENTALQILNNFLNSLTECSDTALTMQNGNLNADSLWRICHRISSSAGLIGFKKYANLTKAISYSFKTTAQEISPEESALVRQLYRQSNELKSSIADCIKLNT